MEKLFLVAPTSTGFLYNRSRKPGESYTCSRSLLCIILYDIKSVQFLDFIRTLCLQEMQDCTNSLSTHESLMARANVNMSNHPGDVVHQRVPEAILVQVDLIFPTIRVIISVSLRCINAHRRLIKCNRISHSGLKLHFAPCVWGLNVY